MYNLFIEDKEKEQLKVSPIKDIKDFLIILVIVGGVCGIGWFYQGYRQESNRQLELEKEIQQLKIEANQKPITPATNPPQVIAQPVVLSATTNYQKPAEHQKVPMVIDGHPWRAFTANCDSSAYNVIQDAIKANNNMNEEQDTCLKSDITSKENVDFCYKVYPMGYKDHMYSKILTDALKKYCGCSIGSTKITCP